MELLRAAGLRVPARFALGRFAILRRVAMGSLLGFAIFLKPLQPNQQHLTILF